MTLRFEHSTSPVPDGEGKLFSTERERERKVTLMCDIYAARRRGGVRDVRYGCSMCFTSRVDSSIWPRAILDKNMSGNFVSGTLKTLNRTQAPPPPNPSPMNESGSSVIDTIRKRMQQIKDELASSQDELHAYQIEREREKRAREQVCLVRHVRWTETNCFYFLSRLKPN